MYLCNDCGSWFEEPALCVEAHADGNRSLLERDLNVVASGYMHCCPACRSEDIDELERCHLCGEYAEELNINGCCEACESALRKKLSALLHANFTREEIEVLNDSLDGEALM